MALQLASLVASAPLHTVQPMAQLPPPPTAMQLQQQPHHVASAQWHMVLRQRPSRAVASAQLAMATAWLPWTALTASLDAHLAVRDGRGLATAKHAWCSHMCVFSSQARTPRMLMCTPVMHPPLLQRQSRRTSRPTTTRWLSMATPSQAKLEYVTTKGGSDTKQPSL